jgi:hypothetical protein
MKDFDFDELDRAVNSVLATKYTKNTEEDQSSANADAPQVVPQEPAADTAVPVEVNDSSDSTSVDVTSEDKSDTISVVDTSDDHEDEGTAISVTTNNSATEESAPEEVSQSSEEEPSESDSNDDQEESEEDSEPEQPQNDEPELLEAPKPEEETAPVDTAALAAIPVKRGRFMDMVAPGTSADGAKKTFPTRSGITISPSADFSSQTEKEAEKPEEEKPVAVDPATPVVDVEVEPEVTTASTTPDDVVAEINTAANTDSTPSDTTPFIPDVPVEKRPLNVLSTPEETSSDDDSTTTGTSEPTANAIDPTLTATIPKEFDKDIMAVESNETVGEHDETHPDVNVGESTNDTTEPAIAATTAEPHPMFDTSTLAHPGDMVGHHTSKFSWAIIGGSLFVVGAALGVLYFLYGQG